MDPSELRGNFEAYFFTSLFFQVTLYLPQKSYNDETHSLCTIEDGEHFGEVKLRLTNCLRGEMRLTIFIFCISSAKNISNSRPSTTLSDCIVIVMWWFDNWVKINNDCILPYNLNIITTNKLRFLFTRRDYTRRSTKKEKKLQKIESSPERGRRHNLAKEEYSRRQSLAQTEAEDRV